MWLPHGLAKDTSLSALQASMRLCTLKPAFATMHIGSADNVGATSCTPQDFDISRASPGVLVLRVPALQPQQRYLFSITDNSKVRLAVCSGGTFAAAAANHSA